jgi:hypothetical protein
MLRHPLAVQDGGLGSFQMGGCSSSKGAAISGRILLSEALNPWPGVTPEARVKTKLWVYSWQNIQTSEPSLWVTLKTSGWIRALLPRPSESSDTHSLLYPPEKWMVGQGPKTQRPIPRNYILVGMLTGMRTYNQTLWILKFPYSPPPQREVNCLMKS